MLIRLTLVSFAGSLERWEDSDAASLPVVLNAGLKRIFYPELMTAHASRRSAVARVFKSRGLPKIRDGVIRWVAVDMIDLADRRSAIVHQERKPVREIGNAIDVDAEVTPILVSRDKVCRAPLLRFAPHENPGIAVIRQLRLKQFE